MKGGEVRHFNNYHIINTYTIETKFTFLLELLFSIFDHFGKEILIHIRYNSYRIFYSKE